MNLSWIKQLPKVFGGLYIGLSLVQGFTEAARSPNWLGGFFSGLGGITVAIATEFNDKVLNTGKSHALPGPALSPESNHALAVGSFGDLASSEGRVDQGLPKPVSLTSDLVNGSSRDDRVAERGSV